MRVCLAYDCLYPWTVGGGERWLRALAETLASKGHQITYLTRCQWDDDYPPEIAGVKVVAVAPREELYGNDGTRTIGQALRYGKGVFSHLLRHRGDYDVVHITASPYFGVLGAWFALRGARPVLFVDWHEAWTRDYWREYLGRWRGELGWLMQQICVRLCRHSFINSELHAERLRSQGIRGELIILDGLYSGPIRGEIMPAQQPPLVVFAGRHIPEKRVLAIPAAIVEARRQQPNLQALILGDGPDHAALLAEIARCGASSFIDAPGFVSAEEVAAAIGQAACLLLPSSREGYGIVIVEAAAKGTPSIVVAGDDNAAVELVSEGENGFVAADASTGALARAIAAAVDGGSALRSSTHSWFRREAKRLSVAESARIVEQSHRAASEDLGSASPPDPQPSLGGIRQMAVRTRMSLDRMLTGSLQAIGLRDAALTAILNRRRRKRLQMEQSGSDALSRPAMYEIDRKLNAIIDKDNGFFVEAGANDGYTQSNTYWLERFRGWHGLLVEPMQELFELCAVERPQSSVRRAALVPFDYPDETITMRFGDLMSSVNGDQMDVERTAAGVAQGWRDAYEAAVPARTLTSLLDEIGAPEVDLLSLDVEGFEPQVLAGLNLEKYPPRWILVEVHELPAGREPIEAILGDRYVLQEQVSPLDLLYRRADVAQPSTRS